MTLAKKKTIESKIFPEAPECYSTTAVSSVLRAAGSMHFFQMCGNCSGAVTPDGDKSVSPYTRPCWLALGGRRIADDDLSSPGFTIDWKKSCPLTSQLVIYVRVELNQHESAAESREWRR